MEAIIEEPSCENCKFWEEEARSESYVVGSCLRYPPVIVGIKDFSLIPSSSELAEKCWSPVTHFNHVCGEWKRCKKR